MRLIDADELLTAFPVGDEPTVTIACIRATIKHMPTIEERKTGKWVSTTAEEFGIYKVRTRRCTHCGERAVDGMYVAGATMVIINYFCPNCGADMRGV